MLTTGTVSHGTLRTEDLLNAFANKLEARIVEASLPADPHPGNMTLVYEARNAHLNDTETTAEILDDLIDALNEYAPDGYYFGAHEGDGSDFGYWPVQD